MGLVERVVEPPSPEMRDRALARDLLSIPPETIRDARVTMTVVGGRVVYERAGS